jgi:hypothetical protein
MRRESFYLRATFVEREEPADEHGVRFRRSASGRRAGDRDEREKEEGRRAAHGGVRFANICS